MKKLLFIIFILSLVTNIFSQSENVETDAFVSDTIVKKKKKHFFKKGHDPAKAALMSAILPGAGQAYNKKYWKIPIVYAGIGGFGAWLGYNSIQLKGYTTAYKHHIEGTDSTASFNGYNTETELNFKRREAKKNLDISAIALSLWYILNIIDATVDAHLFNFDVNDDISISLRPDIKMNNANSLNFENNIYSGLSIQMHFK